MHYSRANSAIKKFPSVLEYLGFSFFYPTILTGPVFDMRHYLDFQKQYGLKKLPGCSKEVLKRLLLVVFSFVILAKGIPLFSRDYMWDGRYYEFSFFKRFASNKPVIFEAPPPHPLFDFFLR